MTPYDGTFHSHDWLLWRHYSNKYPQLQSEFQALWEEMHAYNQSVWYKQRLVDGSRYTVSERPEVPICISKIIAPDEIEPLWFSEWSNAEFPFDREPFPTHEEFGLYTKSELRARRMPARSWYYASSGIALGPVSLWWLAQLIAADQFGPDGWLWQEGLENWIPASEVDGVDFGKQASGADELEDDDQSPEVSIPPPQIVENLEVLGRDLAKILRPIAKLTGVRPRTVSIRFRDGRIIIGLDELSGVIPAFGTWPGVALVSHAFVKKLVASHLETLPIVPVTCCDGWVTIGKQTTRCEWTDSDAAPDSK